ncbi:MAG: MarR family transcriptional regulator [Pseudomonadales bacterium]|nr:MarR family transcriptional regulator [Pseudomonadales bacterium]
MDELRNFGFLLKDVSRRYVLRFEQRAKAMALTLPPCRVLTYLQRHEGISQARLAELTNIEPMAMVRILDPMEAEGLIERRHDPEDRRVRQLYLLPKSRPALEEIWRIADVTRAETFAGISVQERDSFLNTLQRLHDNLCRFETMPIQAEPSPSPLSSDEDRSDLCS